MLRTEAKIATRPFKTMAERTSPDICGIVTIITSAAGDETIVCFHAPGHEGPHGSLDAGDQP